MLNKDNIKKYITDLRTNFNKNNLSIAKKRVFIETYIDYLSFDTTQFESLIYIDLIKKNTSNFEIDNELINNLLKDINDKVIEKRNIKIEGTNKIRFNAYHNDTEIVKFFYFSCKLNAPLLAYWRAMSKYVYSPNIITCKMGFLKEEKLLDFFDYKTFSNEMCQINGIRDLNDILTQQIKKNNLFFGVGKRGLNTKVDIKDIYWYIISKKKLENHLDNLADTKILITITENALYR
jgi:hypothetical protein